AAQAPARCQPRTTRDFSSSVPSGVRLGPGHLCPAFSACRIIRIEREKSLTARLRVVESLSLNSVSISFPAENPVAFSRLYQKTNSLPAFECEVNENSPERVPG